MEHFNPIEQSLNDAQVENLNTRESNLLDISLPVLSNAGAQPTSEKNKYIRGCKCTAERKVIFFRNYILVYNQFLSFDILEILIKNYLCDFIEVPLKIRFSF